jgi:hypothetical protein
MVAEVTARHEIHNEVEGLSVLERLSHVYDEPMLEYFEEFAFVADGLVTLLCEDAA